MSFPSSRSPSSSISTSSSSVSLLNGEDILSSEDDLVASDYSSSTSASSSPRSQSPSKDLREGELRVHQGAFLDVPASTWRKLSRSPSPLGLIPKNDSSFSKFIRKHEIPRKALHVSIGFLGCYLYRNGKQPYWLTTPLTTALATVVSADVLRFYNRDFNALYVRVLGTLMRESEVEGWNGVIWYLVGTITVMTVFPKDVATLSILLLSWVDTAASTFGRAWGKHTPSIRPGKSLAGTFAAAVVGALTAGFWWGILVPGTPLYASDPVDSVMWAGRLAIGNVELTGGWALAAMSVLTGLVASASEVLDCWGLDDNVIIPVVSAAGIWGLLKVFG